MMNITQPVPRMSEISNRQLQAVAFVSVGLFGMFINSITIWAINKCERISKMASLLMMLQCSINIFGLTPKISYAPLVTSLGRHLLPFGLLRRLPGAILMFSLYGGFLLQAIMAITRLIVFRRMSNHQAFSQRTCKLVIVLIMIYGSCWFLLVIHPCCSLVINPVNGRHRFTGYNKRLISIATLTNDLLTFPTMTVCYIWALTKMGNLRSAVQLEHLTWNEVKHEVKVLMQFLLISVVWAVHVGLYRSIQFKIIQMDLWWIMTISEVNRYIFFCIDPVVYCLFIEEVREIVVGRFRTHPIHPHALDENKWVQKSASIARSVQRNARKDEIHVEDVL